MTPQQILAIGLRLTSIALTFAGFQYLGTLLTTDATPSHTTTNSYLGAVIYFFPAIFLWLFPMWSAQKILPQTLHKNHINVHSIEFTRVGCCLIGLWIFSQGVLNSTWHIVWFFIFGGNTSFIGGLLPEARLDLSMSLVTTACGVALMLSNNKVAEKLIR